MTVPEVSVAILLVGLPLYQSSNMSDQDSPIASQFIWIGHPPLFPCQ